MKRIGAIDIGTNSTRLLIIEFSNGKRRELARQAIITRLGEGVEETRHLSVKAIERTIEALVKYRDFLKKTNTNKFLAVATAVLRKTEDASSFILGVRERVGFDVKVLLPEEEAELAFLGATYDLQLEKARRNPILVIDIGGGSTELIVGEDGKVLKLYSLDIGCVSLTEKFFLEDPPSVEEIKEAKKYLEAKISEVSEGVLNSFVKFDSPPIAFGLAGTITTLSAMKQQLIVYDPALIHGSKLNFFDVKNLFQKIYSLSLKKRRELRGLEPARADVIVAGTLILLKVLEKFNLSEITVSEHDILDGIILSQLRNSG